MPDITIRFEHDDFVIIDKPAGVPVQNEDNLQGIIPRVCLQLGIEKLWLVHRLDKATSGLLILAKTQAATSVLSQLFAKRQVSKHYLALSAKAPKKKQGTVAGDMQRVRNGLWKLSPLLENPAVSQFFSYGLGNGVRLFLIKPWTGKTHQIRVMMKSLSSPILGDNFYKGERADRMYLHAFSIQFIYAGEEIKVLCEPSSGEYFISVLCQTKLKRLGQPQTLDWPDLKPRLLNAMQPSNNTEVLQDD